MAALVADALFVDQYATVLENIRHNFSGIIQQALYHAFYGRILVKGRYPGKCLVKGVMRQMVHIITIGKQTVGVIKPGRTVGLREKVREK